MERRQYHIKITINGRVLTQLIIDPHYLKKHSQSVTDKIIIALVEMLNGRRFVPDKVNDQGFEFYVEDKMKLKGKTYKLIWLLKNDGIYVGIVNCYRRD